MENQRHNPTIDPAAPPVDLSQLAVKREARSAPKMRARRRWLTRYAIPGGILLGFASLFGWAARDTFLPAHTVTVTPVIVTKASVQQSGTPLFQAAGWIEPRPSAVVVSALAPGVVETVVVVEGQQLEIGEPIAKLIDVDARLALDQAKAKLRLCDADVRSAAAAVAAARIGLDKPNQLKVALADAESTLAELNLTLGNLPFTIEAAKSRREVAAENVDRKRRAGEAVAGRVLREAQAELAAAENALAELQSRGPTLQQQADALERKQAALAEQLALMSEQKRSLAAAEAAVAAAEAKRDQARLSVDAAKLNVERMTIRAPMTGRILTVDVRPGMRVASPDPTTQQSSSAVVSMYDPRQLQVRVDVRLEDVPYVQVGQPTTIETAALAAPLAGKVSWVTTRADVQKNTLQVKVAIDNPPPVITPEMLGQVTFLALPQPTTDERAEDEQFKILAPRSLVAMADGGGASLWIADGETGTAVLKTVELGKAGTDELVEIASGIDPTAKLIVAGRESLTSGARIRVRGEDRTLSGPPSGPMSQQAPSVARTASRNN